MPSGLKRYQQSDDLHFVTFSCYGRQPHLADTTAKKIFEQSLDAMGAKYRFAVVGYVVMPEHVHLLLSEPGDGTLARALQAVKISVSRQLSAKPFWQRRYYDFNVFTTQKQMEKLDYIHRNPVTRGLVAEPWEGCRGTVDITSEWTVARNKGD